MTFYDHFLFPVLIMLDNNVSKKLFTSIGLVLSVTWHIPVILIIKDWSKFFAIKNGSRRVQAGVAI